jgi:hypothetical protein
VEGEEDAEASGVGCDTCAEVGREAVARYLLSETEHGRRERFEPVEMVEMAAEEEATAEEDDAAAERRKDMVDVARTLTVMMVGCR